MLFALIANDRPDGLEDRLKHRPDHMKHLDWLAERLIMAGPFLDQAGNPTGSLMVIEAENQGEAEQLFGKDPFVERGVFGNYEIRPWRFTINNVKPA